MSHWIIAPVVLPAMLAAIMMLAARHVPVLSRSLAMAGTLAQLAIAVGLFVRALGGEIEVYLLGDWAPPFGIVLVADRLSTFMVLLTALLAPLVLLYAIGSGWDRKGRGFHTLFQFQIMGIMGAFLTGDIFNLFVFFEVLLIASYGLMIHGGGTARLRAGVQYVLYNLLGSTLFLFALGALYAETGTLNMADLSERVAGMNPQESAAIRTAAVLLLLVFAIKAAVAPLHFWLPNSYAEAPGPVAALFAIMTKVGAYAIIRVYTLIFPPDLELTAGLWGTWLMPLALAGVVVGMVGVLGAVRLDRLVAFSVIGSMGMLLAAVATFTETGIAAALYYVAHSTFAAAALFLIVDLVRRWRPDAGVALRAAPPLPGGALLAGMFFAAAIAMAGLPPLSGFVGKLLVLQATTASPLVWWAWAVILAASLVAVVGFARAGSTLFWKAHEVDGTDGDATEPESEQGTDENRDPPAHASRAALTATGGLLALIALHTVAAGPVKGVLDAASAQLFAPANYISAVMSREGKPITYTPHDKDKTSSADDTAAHGDEGGH